MFTMSGNGYIFVTARDNFSMYLKKNRFANSEFLRKFSLHCWLLAYTGIISLVVQKLLKCVDRAAS